MRIYPKTSKYLLTAISTGAIFLTICCAKTSILEAATLNTSDIPSTFKFTKNLKSGDTVSPDISYLQFILNQSGDTQVSASGAGSLDNLTNYFGSKTKSAVMNFQEKFRKDILTPANIASPTGIVGERTRAKLNQVLGILLGGSYTESNIFAPLPDVISSSNTSNQTKVFTSNLSNTTDANPTTSASVNPANKPIITSFSTFKAISGQFMSLFGAQFHSTKNTLYLGSENIGLYPSLDNGTKITFKVPATLDTGSYEVGVANTYGTTSTGFMYLNVTKPTVSTSTPTIDFVPTLTTVYPNTSKNLNDLIFLYGDNFSFNNTLETNLGNTVVRSTNRKTLSFMISELPYYTEAFKKYKGQSINVLMKLRNENGLSKEQLVHVINFPNSDIPSVNTSLQQAPASFNIGTTTDDAYEMLYRQQAESATATVNYAAPTNGSSTNSNSSGSGSGSSSGGSSSGSGGGSSMGGMSDPNSMLDSVKPPADPLLEQLRSVSPVHKFLSDPLVKGESSSGGGGGAAGGLAGGAALGGAGGSGGGAGGGSMVNFGGTITQATVCTCSYGLPTLLSIKDVRGSTIQAMYQPGVSSLKQNYNIWTPGVNTLGGMYSGGQSCQVGVTPYCTSQGSAQYTIDFIRGIGTSLAPAK